MLRLTDFALRNTRLVVAAWLLVTLGAFASSSAAVGALSASFDMPGREGYETNREIVRVYGNGGTAAPLVPVIALPEGTTVDSPRVRGEATAALARVQRAVPRSRLASYFSTGDRDFVSDDGRTTYALVITPEKQTLHAPPELAAVQKALRGVTVAGEPVRLTGVEALRVTPEGEGSSPSVLVEALLGGLGALAVLALVFASAVALLPILIATVAIPTTFMLVWALTTLTEVSAIVQFLVALIGLGVAIDYALLIVMRWREERQRGAANDDAVRRAMREAGSAVVFSGTTVAIGLLALVAIPVPFLRSMGIAGMLIPLVSVAVAITLLPVLLATIGPRLDRRRAERPDRASRAWSAWARAVVARRGPAALVATAVLAALVVPAASIELGSPKAEALATTGPARAAYEALVRSGIGPGPLTPLDVLVRSGDPTAVEQRVAGVDGVAAAIAPVAWRAGGTSLVAVIPEADANSSEGRETLSRVRDALHAEPATGGVGGWAAQTADFVTATYGNFPLMVGLIVVLTFLLLMRAFRSILLPLKAVLLNVTSVGAAWGIMVLVWQKGYGSELIWDIPATGAITEWAPTMVFAFLFGLSMDYEVFILARMREEYDRTGSTNEAVVRGIERTGRLVTSAALILFLAFVALGSSPGTEIKIVATGLAAGILFDATVIRGLLVPATVSLFGRWNWWLPRLPARLLRVPPSNPVGEVARDGA